MVGFVDVFLLAPPHPGGATAVDRGWRDSTIDADLSASDDRLFAQVQQIKERLRINIELARPEDFVPPL